MCFSSMLKSPHVSFIAHLSNLKSLHSLQGRAEAHGPAEEEEGEKRTKVRDEKQTVEKHRGGHIS